MSQPPSYILLYALLECDDPEDRILQNCWERSRGEPEGEVKSVGSGFKASNNEKCERHSS